MALRDDIFSKESYYIVEIKSLKRIMDMVNEKVPVLCFVDGVRREGNYSNYHFQEYVKENEVLFDYKLYPGRAVSKNAIKLLRMLGYDEGMTAHAEARVKHFEESGSWTI